MEGHDHQLYTPDLKKADKNQNIQVFVRVRPMNSFERSKHSTTILDCPGVREVVVKDRTPINVTKTYTFDRVFGPLSKQIDVYKNVVVPLLDEVLLGYNCTVFAYGQTGTGKTFTMEGERTQDGNKNYSWETDPLAGVVPRALAQLFEQLRSQNAEFTVRVSLLELYNEELFDLLAPLDSKAKGTTLRIFEDTTRKGSVIIQGLEEVTVHSKNEVYAIMERGSDRRKTAATQLNANSSRSHTIFTVTVHIKETTLEGEELLKIGKLHLVDLAGSENIGRSGAVDKRAKEAGSINQSLLTLGRVITALVERTPHIPYRESKLTRLLQDSLGGRTKTSIIATVSPSNFNIEETLSTLDYAHRAKNIMNRPEINQRLTKKAMLKAYTEEIERLRRDLVATREKNGVFMDKENYDNMMARYESTGQDLLDKSNENKLLQEEKEKKEEEIVELRAALLEREEELELANSVIFELKMKLELREKQLLEMTQEKNEMEHLVDHHQITEKKLSQEAKLLLNTSKAATIDLEKLYSKLERKKSIEACNLENGTRLRRELLEQYTVLNNSLQSFRLDHSEFCGTQRMKLDTFLQKKEEQYQKVSLDIDALLTEMNVMNNAIAKTVSDHTGNMSLTLSETLEGTNRRVKDNKVEINKFLTGFLKTQKTEINDKLLKVNEQLIQLFNESKAGLEEQRSAVTGYAIMNIEKLNEYRKFLKERGQEQESAFAVAQEFRDRQDGMFKVQIEKIQTMTTEVIEQAQKLMENAVYYKTAMTANTDAMFKKIATNAAHDKDYNKKMRALFDTDRIEIEALRDKLSSTTKLSQGKVEVIFKNTIDINGEGQNQFDQITAEFENELNKGLNNYDETRKFVEEEIQNHRNGSEFFNTTFQKHIEGSETEVKVKMEGITKDLEIAIDADVEQIQAEKGELENHCNEFSNWTEQRRNFVGQQMGKVNEFWDSTYLIDAPTGATPQKKAYIYPMSLSSTSPHERILSRFRVKGRDLGADLAEDNENV